MAGQCRVLKVDTLDQIMLTGPAIASHPFVWVCVFAGTRRSLPGRRAAEQTSPGRGPGRARRPGPSRGAVSGARRVGLYKVKGFGGQMVFLRAPAPEPHFCRTHVLKSCSVCFARRTASYFCWRGMRFFGAVRVSTRAASVSIRSVAGYTGMV